MRSFVVLFAVCVSIVMCEDRSHVPIRIQKTETEPAQHSDIDQGKIMEDASASHPASKNARISRGAKAQGLLGGVVNSLANGVNSLVSPMVNPGMNGAGLANPGSINNSPFAARPGSYSNANGYANSEAGSSSSTLAGNLLGLGAGITVSHTNSASNAGSNFG